MPGAAGFAAILLGGGLLAFLYGEREILGLVPEEFARWAAAAALALLAAHALFGHFRGRWGEALRSLAIWVVVFAGVVGAYTYRYELQTVADRMVSELAPGRTTSGPGGEVTVSRGLHGSFTVAGQANGSDLRFIFDTGANVVVLTAESVRRIGIDPESLSYTVPVMTANGRTMAAPLTLESLSVGSIVERRVPALVARPGALQENLLGMSFLDRLASYEVRDNRLILRGRGA